MSLPNRSTIQNYDGQNKINNQAIPPSNQATDFDNTKLGVCVGDVAAMGLTAPRFWCRMTLAASTGALVLNNWQSVWANATPTTPILTRVGTGHFTITLPTTVSDEYDASFGITNNITVNLNAANANFEGNSLFGILNTSASGNVITVYCSTSGGTGSLNDFVGTVLFCVAY